MKYWQTKVVTGFGRGKQLGFPTLNLLPPPGFDAKQGIYAAWVRIAGQQRPAALHWGPVPSFGQSQVSLEAYLLDTDLADRPESVEFALVKYLRPVRRFNQPEQLIGQISQDVKQCRQILIGNSA